MLQTLIKQVGRAFCPVRVAPRAADGRALDAPPFGVRRQSEAATALLLIECRPLTSKRRRASLAAALHIFRNGCFNLLRQSSIILVALALLAPGCRTAPRHETETTVTFEAPAPYVRASNAESNVLELQIAARRFVPIRGKGPAVWLTGVSHIGSSNYFAKLQRHLNAQTLVLFEGVGEHSQDFAKKKPSDSPGNTNATANAGGAGLQSSLANSLGLVFQLDTIDYDRPNFRHSDLSIREIRELLAEPRGSGGGDAAQDFDNLLSMMEGDSFMNIVMQFGLGILASSPRLQAMSKVTLIEVITEMGGDPSRLGAISPELKQLLEVLIAKRNQRVIDDLKTAR